MNKTQKQLKQQGIVITGALSGIGLCPVKLAAERGGRLVFVACEAQALSGAS